MLCLSEWPYRQVLSGKWNRCGYSKQLMKSVEKEDGQPIAHGQRCGTRHSCLCRAMGLCRLAVGGNVQDCLAGITVH